MSASSLFSLKKSSRALRGAGRDTSLWYLARGRPGCECVGQTVRDFGSTGNYIPSIQSGKDEHGLERRVARGSRMDRQIEGCCLEETFCISLGLMRGVGLCN